MEPLAGRSCLYTEDGCSWQVPQCDQDSITAKEADLYVKSHSTGCLYSPVAVKETQHRREQEAAERARRWAAEDKARARRWAAEDKAEAQSWADGAEVYQNPLVAHRRATDPTSGKPASSPTDSEVRGTQSIFRIIREKQPV